MSTNQAAWEIAFRGVGGGDRRALSEYSSTLRTM